jgi:phospholipid/cholesterol/gamma-HCH transport system permease protein
MRDHTASAEPVSPAVEIGQGLLEGLAYLGAFLLLGLGALRAIVRPKGRPPGLIGAVVRNCDKLMMMGLPLVALAHVGLGSFLAMQAFYGATFVEGVGPVVGTGLLRNLAPLVTGLTMAGVIAGCFTTELRGPLERLDFDPLDRPNRGSSGASSTNVPAAEPERLAAVRLLAVVIAGPPLVLWGSVVGIGVGAVVAQAMLGVPLPIFFAKFLEMLWVRDVVGLLVKGCVFALVSGLFACHEGLRRPVNSVGSTTNATFRAVCLSSLMILVLNNTWFTLAYLAGPAFGPTVLTPPPR